MEYASHVLLLPTCVPCAPHVSAAYGLYVTHVIKLTGLAPDITAAILNGRQPKALQLNAIIRKNIPYCWNEQREMLGFKHVVNQ